MKLYVEKKTGTYADTLKAVGLADLLKEITGHDVRIRNQGASYELEGIDLEPIANWPIITPGYPYILDSKDTFKPVGMILDYEREKQKAQFAREYRQVEGKKKERLEAKLREQGLTEPEEPVVDYRIASFLASMRKGWSSDKQLFLWINDNQQAAKVLVANMLGIANCEKADCMPEISCSQVFNPTSGKGTHRPKPDSTAPAAINKAVINEIDEWLKFRGAFKAMAPYRSGDDYKVYVLEPGDINIGALFEIRIDLMRHVLYGNIRLDVEALLRVLMLLLKSSLAAQAGLNLFTRLPSSVITGLHQAYFKSLGSASALMNYSFMPMPSWFEVDNADDVEAYLAIIKEHAGDKRYDNSSGCIRVLREDNSGDISILQNYRDWLLSGELSDLLAFFGKFAVKVMDCRSHNEWVREFSAENLDLLLERGYAKVREIIENDGFKSIARAIRNATIYAVSIKNRDIHFGLAQEWKQKIKGGDKAFVATLSDFIQQYNWESEKIRDKSHKPAHVVQQGDIDNVINLIGDHGVELVGMLLLAYGYARAPKAEYEEQGVNTSED